MIRSEGLHAISNIDLISPFIIKMMFMVKQWMAAALVLVLFSCNNASKAPDVGSIKVDLTTERFEKQLFDTTSKSLLSYLQNVQSHNPSFLSLYISEILNADLRMPADSIAAYVNGFVQAYRPVYDTAEMTFKDFTPYEEAIKKGLQYVKFYYPEYKAPRKIITYIGPADGYGDILADTAFLVGLHHHLGKDFSLYKSELVRETYPDYVSYNFEPDHIAINCMKNIVNDMYPEKEEDRSLVYQMVEKGKRLYLLSKFLPATAENKLIGYTEKQMKECYLEESVIWNTLFIKNDYLQITDKNIIKNYIGDSPKTQELGEGAPGNIGSFAGWQIVKQYASKNPSVTPAELMKMDNEEIFKQAKYKP